MHKSQYEKAGWIQHHSIVAHRQTCAPCLQPVVRSFAANVARVESAWLLLPTLVDTSVTSTKLSVQAVYEVLGTFDMDDPRQQDPVIQAAIQERFLALGMTHMQKIFDREDVLVALARFDHLLCHSQQPFVTHGVETILASQILNAWTAVESFLKDLWETAVNHGPRQWTNRVLEAKAVRGLKEQERSVPLSILQRHEYDVRLKMGSILKAKVPFETLEEVLAAYATVFGEEITRTYTPAMLTETRALEATRHLLAHRGGVVDRKFKGVVKQIARFASVEEGKQMHINGEMAGELARNGIALSLAILDDVDQRLKQAEANS